MVDKNQESFLQTYLDKVVQATLTSSFQPDKQYYFYLGNEAADADSIISALTWACISHHLHEHSSSSSFSSSSLSSPSSVHIPLIQVPREEYQLRPETKLLLEKQSINFLSIPSMYDLSKNIPFYHDLLLHLHPEEKNKEEEEEEEEEKKKKHNNNLHFILLDHNLLSEKFRTIFQLQENSFVNILQILDHHQDLRAYLDQCPDDHSPTQRLVAFDEHNKKALVASTCTIIQEQLHQLTNLLEKGLLYELSYLLLGVILIDSLNMDPKAGKGTPRDVIAIQQLQNILQFQEKQSQELFHSLISAKNSETFWQEISMINCLKFDYKMFLNEKGTKRVGYSSVLIPIQLFLQKIIGNLEQNVNQLTNYYSDVENLNLLVILSFYQGRREIFLISKNEDLVELTNRLRNVSDLSLSSLELEESRLLLKNGYSVSVFSQGNVTYSRKQIAPIISALFD